MCSLMLWIYEPTTWNIQVFMYGLNYGLRNLKVDFTRPEMNEVNKYHRSFTSLFLRAVISFSFFKVGDEHFFNTHTLLGALSKFAFCLFDEFVLL